MVHLANDHVVVVTREFTTLRIISRSTTDGGTTWSDAIVLDTSTYANMEYAQGQEIYPGLIAAAYSVEIAAGNADMRFLWMGEGGNPDAADALVGSSLTVYGGDITIIGGGQIVSTTPTGTAPLVVASTTKVDNLNADMVDGLHASQLGHTIQNEGTPLTARANLNFVGTLVNATDDAGNNATVVTVNGALNDLSDVDTTGEATGDVIYDNAGTWQVYPLGLGSRITVSGTKIRFGNVAGGNYLEIDSVTGTLRLVGDATTYDDFRVEASVVKPGATAPSYKAFGPSGNLQALMFEAGHHDEAMFEVQMPHNWKIGTNIYPHVHWTPVDTTAGNVVWELEYSWSNVGDAFGAPSNMASDATAAGGVAWVHKLTYLKSGGNNYIDGTGKTLSSMLVCRLHRNSNSGSDTLNKDVAFLEVDFHYQIDSLGSDEELVKDASASLLLEAGDILLLETGDRLLLE